MSRFALRLGTLVMALVLSCLANRGHAGTISTPVLADFSSATSAVNAAQWRCECANVSNKSLTVTAELVESDGTVKDSQTCLIPPGETCCQATWNEGPGQELGWAYCRFLGGSKNTLRGSILHLPANSSQVNAALPAQ